MLWKLLSHRETDLKYLIDKLFGTRVSPDKLDNIDKIIKFSMTT